MKRTDGSSYHTGGTWEASLTPDGKVVVESRGLSRSAPRRVAEICQRPEHDIQSRRANAKLIAAAPELLGACEEMLAHELNSNDPNPYIVAVLNEALWKARAGDARPVAPPPSEWPWEG